jgi:hypothetical protein
LLGRRRLFGQLDAGGLQFFRQLGDLVLVHFGGNGFLPFFQRALIVARCQLQTARLVSELRLAHATTLQPANAVLDRFCADYNQRFARPAADAACDFRSLPRRFDLARCLSLRYQRVVAADHTVTLGAHSIALPSLPGHRGYAGETVELSHQLDGTLRVYRGDVLLLTQSLPLQENADRRPAPRTTAQKPKPTMPRIYNLSGRPALAAVT